MAEIFLNRIFTKSLLRDDETNAHGLGLARFVKATCPDAVRARVIKPRKSHGYDLSNITNQSKQPNALRVSRAAFFPKSASTQDTTHNPILAQILGRGSGVGLHALVRMPNSLHDSFRRWLHCRLDSLQEITYSYKSNNPC